MRKKLIVILFFLILIFNVYNVNSFESKIDKLECLNAGRIEEKDGVKTIFLNGSYYEMGCQFGTLLKDEYMICRRAWINYFEKNGVIFQDLIGIWNETKNYIPQNYKEEMQGRADALDLEFEEVAALDMINLGLYYKNACCSMALWGEATKDGELLHAHSADFKLDLCDPVTGNLAHDYQLLIIRKPVAGYASISVGSPIEVGIEGGINEKGIVISYTAVSTLNKTSHGIPIGIRQRMVLDYASNISHAVNIVNSNRTVGWNFIISDRETPIGYAVEQNANFSYFGTWNNTVENNYPSKSVKDVVRRCNFFLDTESADIDGDIYKKSTFFNWVLSIFKTSEMQDPFMLLKHYTVLSKSIENNWGDFDLNNTMSMLRFYYNGWTEFRYFFIKKVFKIYTENWHQWVICPETGEILISFAEGGKSAHKNQVHYFSVNELIEGL